MFVGLFRHHTASMISRLGHPELANALRDLTSVDAQSAEDQATDHAQRLLHESSEKQTVSRDDYPRFRRSVGGIVTRSGPMTVANASRL